MNFFDYIVQGLKAGEGLSFPHHGPFVINEGTIIGEYAYFPWCYDNKRCTLRVSCRIWP